MKVSSGTERLSERNGRKIAKLLREVVEACRAEGLRNPNLYFEPESAAIFVMDGDHPHDIDANASMGERQEAIVARMPVADIGCPFGAGAW